MKIKQFLRRFLSWIGAAGLLLALVGCSNRIDTTKFEPIPLDTVQMVETAAQSGAIADATSATGNTETTTVDLYARLGAPTNYTAELQSEKGYLKVHVNAAVELPSAELPVVRTQAHRFTTEDAERIATTLFGSDAHYIDNLSAGEHFTKAYAQQEIDDLSDSIAHWDTYGNLKYDLRYYTLEEAQQALSDLQALQPTLPDTIPAITPDFSNWELMNASNEQGVIKTSDSYQIHFAMPNDATVSSLNLMDNTELQGKCSFDYVRDIKKYYGVMQSELEDVGNQLTVSQQDAEAQAKAIVDAIGFSDFVCAYGQPCLSDNKDFAYYRFFFLRQIDGANVNYWNNSSYAGENMELIQVGVDDEGILRVSYDNAQDILGDMTAASELLPFTQIQSVFEKMILVVNNQTESEVWNKDDASRLTVDYDISSVRLGLMNVLETNGSTSRLYIPVWTFYGVTTSQVNDKPAEKYGTNGQSALLTINAIDGTVIEQK
jgi:hypothetical protein